MSTHDEIKAEEIENLDIEKYRDKYSEEGLWEKIRKNIAKIGAKVIYQALLLFYVAQSPNCPAGIIGALGYLISPLDLVPDFMPGIGFADDAAAIAAAVALAQVYINDEIRAQARAKIVDLLGEDALAHIED